MTKTHAELGEEFAHELSLLTGEELYNTLWKTPSSVVFVLAHEANRLDEAASSSIMTSYSRHIESIVTLSHEDRKRVLHTVGAAVSLQLVIRSRVISVSEFTKITRALGANSVTRFMSAGELAGSLGLARWDETTANRERAVREMTPDRLEMIRSGLYAHH